MLALEQLRIIKQYQTHRDPNRSSLPLLLSSPLRKLVVIWMDPDVVEKDLGLKVQDARLTLTLPACFSLAGCCPALVLTLCM